MCMYCDECPQYQRGTWQYLALRHEYTHPDSFTTGAFREYFEKETKLYLFEQNQILKCEH